VNRGVERLTAEQLHGLFPDSQNLAMVFIDGNGGRFIQNDPAWWGVDERVDGA